MDYKIMLFAFGALIVGIWIIVNSWLEWKKGVTQIRYIPFFGSRRWESVYRHDEPVIFHLILLERLIIIEGGVGMILYYTLYWYLYERL